MFSICKRALLKKIIIFLTGLLVSQWIFVIKDMSFMSNLITTLIVIISASMGFSQD